MTDPKQRLHGTSAERIYFQREEMLAAESRVVHHEHLRRYGAIRRFCYGTTLDLACGCGYGSYLIAVNPDVTAVTAIDSSEESVRWAEREFAHPKISYRVSRLEEVAESIDTLVCLETIEHVPDTSAIPALVERCEIDNVIVSFPDKKSTHYNPFHFHDFVLQDIIDLFPRHLAYHTIRFVDCQSVLLVRAPKGAPAHLFRNIRDL